MRLARMKWGRRRGPPSPKMRRGEAVVELAVVTPLLLLMLFGIMEFGWAFMVHETLTNGVREACRVAVLQGSTAEDAEARFALAIASTNLTATPTIEYVDTDDPPDGVNDTVNVSVSVPYSEVTITGLGSFLGIQREFLGAVCSMRREGV